MPQRHQTLRATIAGSFDALGAQERTLLARLSVLPASADLPMIEAVCGADLDVLPLLEVLVDRSMVRVHQPDRPTGDVGYSLLVAVRDYATEQLDSREAHALRDRHADHLTQMVSAPRSDPERSRVVGALLPHVRAALAHRNAHPDQRYVDLVVALEAALIHQGLSHEFEAMAAAALPLAVRPDDKAAILLALANCGQYDELPARAGAALDAALLSGDPELIAASAVLDAFCARIGPELDAVLAVYGRYRDQLSIVTRESHDGALATNLGNALRYVDPARAEGLLRDRLAVVPDDGPVQVRLADILLDHGRVAEARELLRPAEPLPNVYDIVRWEYLVVTGRARLALADGNLSEARELVVPVFDRFVQAADFPFYPGQVLTDLERAADDPRAVIDIADRALAVNDDRGSYEHETLRWRRGRALLELGRPGPARADLERARTILEADPSQGPRELLGCLAAQALLVHRDNPHHAAQLLQSIGERRGGWILPHYADHDIATVEAALLAGR